MNKIKFFIICVLLVLYYLLFSVEQTQAQTFSTEKYQRFCNIIINSEKLHESVNDNLMKELPDVDYVFELIHGELIEVMRNPAAINCGIVARVYTDEGMTYAVMITNILESSVLDSTFRNIFLED